MRFKFTVFLLALNVITFGLILSLKKKTEQADTQTGGLSGMIGREVIEADRIELKSTSLDALWILEKDGSSWKMTAPMQWPANYFAINRILNQLQFLEEEASFSISEIKQTGQTLADYGLEEPWLTLTVSNEDESIELSVGTPTEIGNNSYLLGPSKQNVFVVSTSTPIRTLCLFSCCGGALKIKDRRCHSRVCVNIVRSSFYHSCVCVNGERFTAS